MWRGGVRAVAMAAILAGPGQAQPATAPAADPIGDILDRTAQQEPPGETGQPSTAPPRHSARGAVTPEMSDAAYDARIRASLASAQSFRGPLEGGWTLASPLAGDLYDLQLSDGGKGRIEGAWRDLRKVGAPNGSGFIDNVEQTGRDLTLRFADGRVIASLHTQPGRAWRGEITEAGAVRAVELKRRGP